MNRRKLFHWMALTGISGAGSLTWYATTAATPAAPKGGAIEKLTLTDEQWKKKLSEVQYQVLRHEATEAPFSSPLNEEKRKGVYQCAGCQLPLFRSEMKYDSGTGWPSFYLTLPGALGTRTDFKLIFPRTEYHCIRCAGHQGHVFDDGPKPSGKRYCNNGVALSFVPDPKT